MSSNNNQKDITISLDNLVDIKKTIDAWVNNADIKASAIIAFNGVSITLMFSKLADIKNVLLQRYCTDLVVMLSTLLLAFYFISLVLSLFYVFLTLRAKITTDVQSPIYFGSIAKLTLEEYKKQLRDMKQSDSINAVVEQVHTVSLIANKKFTNINKAIDFLFLSLIYSFISLILIIFI